ncbi:MAG: 30S ribosomal protein S2 [Candidatus Magasanikbacteria bacterium]|nr:30S ribosomal protein S2 [Candidatus Magasanikbacteria bacterium]
MKIPSIEEMLKAGVHFGHQKSRWHPKMDQFIFTDRNGVHVINLEKTQEELKKVLEIVKQMTSEGKVILFTTTKPHAKEIVKEAAISCGTPYLVDRWIGGMLTNFTEIQKLIKKYLTYKEEKATGEWERYTKKEALEKQRELDKMEEYISGISTLEKIPDVLFTPTVQQEKTAIVEANRLGVKVVGVCDTNANPIKVDYVIPGNDDAMNSIKMMSVLVANAVKEGKVEYEKNQKAQAQPVKAV